MGEADVLEDLDDEIGLGLDGRRNLAHPVRAQWTPEDVTHHRVVRRVGAQRDALEVRVDLVVDEHTLGRGERAPVGQRGPHVAIARQRVVAVAFHVHDRALRTEVHVERVRIDARMMLEQVDVADRDGAALHGGHRASRVLKGHR